MLAVVFGAGPAYADLAAGTPKFTCVAPTQNTDGTAIPATGTLALKEFHFYLDAAATFKTITGTTCAWQTAVGDIPPGSHVLAVTAVNNSGQESVKSNTVPFVLPQPTPQGPTGLTVQ